MRLSRRFCLVALVLVVPRAAAAQGLEPTSHPVLDHASRSFWEAGSEKDAESAAAQLAAAGAEPEVAWRVLSRGRVYSARVGKGRLNLEHQTPDGRKHRYTLVVPAGYNPAVPMPLRIYLHGGVDTEDRNSARLWDFDRFHAGDGLALYPSAWRGSMWWTGGQLENLAGILANLKRTYNIDENRIHVIGVSDGGTGAFFLAFKRPTPFAGFVSLIGHGGALANPRLGAAGPFFVTNLRNSPFFAVNGALDPLFPVREVAPYVALYRQAGVNFAFRPRAAAGHDLRWWPEAEPAVDSFIRAHPRRPFPDTISWETSDPETSGRAWWLRIDELGTVAGESPLPALDSIVPLRPEPSLGVRADPGSTQGVRLLAVLLGSMAGEAGLQAGDRIVEANGIPTPTVPALLQASQGLTWGDTLVLIIDREGTARRIRVLFGPSPPAVQAPVLAFPHPLPSGRVDVVATGNRIEARTRGVRRFTLLLSPSQFNLDAPVTVVANGQTVFEGRVARSAETLVRWALQDRDRAMLYLAELPIELHSSRSSP